MEPGVSLEAASLFLRVRGKVVYILPTSNPTLALLLVGFTEYDHDHHHLLKWIKFLRRPGNYIWQNIIVFLSIFFP
ncbi:hypothetical protein Hanom_Chr05g00448971 [Helianthus anomalus]